MIASIENKSKVIKSKPDFRKKSIIYLFLLTSISYNFLNIFSSLTFLDQYQAVVNEPEEIIINNELNERVGRTKE